MSKKTLTTEEFIKKSTSIHGEKYIYSKSSYVSNVKKINIICKIHGSFYQTPNSHLNGSGCPKCAIQNSKLSTKKFVEKAKLVHGDKYDYSKVEYKNCNDKIVIICPIHGEFLQSPHGHLQKKICYKCAIENSRLSTEKFIEKSNKIHNSLYNYSKTRYINCHSKVHIICKYHGEFIQNPNNHLNGMGCPKCFSFISKPEIAFLNKLNIPESSRQIYIKPYRIDGYLSEINTIYEFLGDYWHGNPKKYRDSDINKQSNKTFGELYKNTLKKFNILKQLGYNIKYIWETDWKLFTSGIEQEPNILTYL
jgi:hypothetical protein